jgi:hypothetical protein
MGTLRKNIYKPKEKNVVKLKNYIKKIEKNGK